MSTRTSFFFFLLCQNASLKHHYHVCLQSSTRGQDKHIQICKIHYSDEVLNLSPFIIVVLTQTHILTFTYVYHHHNINRRLPTRFVVLVRTDCDEKYILFRENANLWIWYVSVIGYFNSFSEVAYQHRHGITIFYILTVMSSWAVSTLNFGCIIWMILFAVELDTTFIAMMWTLNVPHFSSSRLHTHILKNCRMMRARPLRDNCGTFNFFLFSVSRVNSK